ncbi:hypothetical protein PUN28_005114 [Cardiocondyla obscurior]|uniref:Uncharacterized protein n=1 Tax=Cardiocondyla obscurior TaxID=286306 RepID=A0AAW2GE86_9HYME
MFISHERRVSFSFSFLYITREWIYQPWTITRASSRDQRAARRRLMAPRSSARRSAIAIAGFMLSACARYLFRDTARYDTQKDPPRRCAAPKSESGRADPLSGSRVARAGKRQVEIDVYLTTNDNDGARSPLNLIIFEREGTNPSSLHGLALESVPRISRFAGSANGSATSRKGGRRVSRVRRERHGGIFRRDFYTTLTTRARIARARALCMSNAIIERVSRLVPAGPVPSRPVSSRLAGSQGSPIKHERKPAP